jgi:hypothetical protein
MITEKTIDELRARTDRPLLVYTNGAFKGLYNNGWLYIVNIDNNKEVYRVKRYGTFNDLFNYTSKVVRSFPGGFKSAD